ncbi:hypothetical protein [Croceitalea rosinachiae]|uniref:Uncharacterized protein n=1 Tax=Croceitalea rosinachiae TaxID=3075596 RepID=A0ABU3ACK9_9FLAO|nr:hypothetical protein [Croceitalea sp. F388]MDT0607915.1 hypothetical protein [Croceitalea sp. F388]
MGKDSNKRKSFFIAIRRCSSLVMVAVMLGISNIILEEDRSVNDTRVKTEVLQTVDDSEDVD